MGWQAYDLANKVLDTYSRISDDPLDLQRGVGRQRQDARDAVEALAAALGMEHVENDTSAYRKRQIQATDANGNIYTAYRVIRPVWTEALHRLRTGEVDGLIVYDLDRLARDPRDLEDAIEIVEHYGKVIISATASDIDLTTETGRLAARLSVMIANKASADTGRRVKRAARQTAELGIPVGWRTFGWNADKVTLDPVESRLARDAVADILSAARSVGTIAREWTEAGITTVQGKAWRQVTLRQYLKNPRLAGYRTYNREIFHGADGSPVIGIWEPLLDVATWESVVAALTARPDARGRIPRKSARRYLLTAILRCGNCNGPMYGNYEKGRNNHYYRCVEHRAGEEKHTNTIAGRQVEEAIEKLVFKYATEMRGTRVRDVSTFPREPELADAQAQITELMAAFRSKQLSGALVFPQVQQLEAAVAVLDAERKAWAARASEPTFDDIAATWNDPETTMDRKRAMIEQIFSAILVRPRTLKGNVFDYTRIVPLPRDL